MTPAAVARALLIAVGIMSATVLARDGFNIGLYPGLSNILDSYERWLDDEAQVGMDALMRDVFTQIGERYAIDMQLLPHWKHPTLLMWLVFASYVRASALNPAAELRVGLANVSSRAHLRMDILQKVRSTLKLASYFANARR